jgi:FHA domain
MAAFEKVPFGQSDEPPAYLVVNDGRSERRVPIFDQLFVGRECAGISEPRRLVLPDPEVSRTHLEIRLDAGGDQAFVIDTSSNGTSLNGVRLERAVLVPIKPGDEIQIGYVALTFLSQRFTTVKGFDPQSTQSAVARPGRVADPHGLGCGAGHGRTRCNDQTCRRGDRRCDQRGIPAVRAGRPPGAGRGIGDQWRTRRRRTAIHLGRKRIRRD